VDWLQILLGGALAVALIFLFRPGIGAALEKSRHSKADWPAVLIPVVLVLLFVVVLVMMV